MSFRELSMIEVKEVLRRHQAGQGTREIARATGLDRKTVRRYLAAAHETFDDVLLAQSAVDRFVNAAFDLVVDGESYRTPLKPRVRDDDPPPEAPRREARAPATAPQTVTNVGP